MTQHRHHIIEHSHQTRCPACHSIKIQTAAQVWAEGTTYGNHQGYALSVGKIRARSVYQTELAAQVSPPNKPEIDQLPFVLWLLYWMPGWIWDLFYCLTGGMSQPQYVRLVITKFITLIIVSLLIFGLQTLINLPSEQRYQQELRRWRNTFVCVDCGTCFVKKWPTDDSDDYPLYLPTGRGYLGDVNLLAFALFLKHLPFATAPLDVTLFTSSDASIHSANLSQFIYPILC